MIELGVKLPRIDIRGKYEVSGNVLLFPVRSKGDFWAIFRKLYRKIWKNSSNLYFSVF